MIWAATPIFTEPSDFDPGPLVARRQSGFEQRRLALLASRSTTALLNSWCAVISDHHAVPA